MKGVPVLMYHALEDADHSAGAKDAGEQLYVLQVWQFREQMEYLAREGYRTFLLEELHALEVWPEKAVVLTFDDGHESNFTLALPILQEFGFKAEFFITTGWIGTPYFMTEDQIMGLHLAGMGIGSHGVSHRYLTDLPIKDIEQECLDSRTRLECVTCCPITKFSAPGGRVDRPASDIITKSGYEIICSSKLDYIRKDESSQIVPRFALRAMDTFETFVDIIRQNKKAICAMAMRSRILNILKTFLGNKRYETIRSKVMFGRS